MASRVVVAKELAELFKIISHPDRLRLVEELRSVGRDVGSLAEVLDLAPARVSQHLSMMRAHRLVEESRDGRRHLYKLRQPEVADWILGGLDFIGQSVRGVTPGDIRSARASWSKQNTPSAEAETQ